MGSASSDAGPIGVSRAAREWLHSVAVLKRVAPDADDPRMQSHLLPRWMSHRLFRGDSERGMSMIELMVSLVVFAIAATAIVAGLLSTMQSTRSSRNRLQASSLASREMEILRNEFNMSAAAALAVGSANVTNPHQLPGGVAGQDLKVDGSPYTVTRNVEWLPAGTGMSACDGGAALTYPSLAVNVSVSWPRMGSVKPVVSNTVLTPPKNTLASTISFVGVKIVDVLNAKVAGLTVTLVGPGGTFTDTTAVDGCAVFALTTPGAYTASLSTGGVYVDPIGVTNPSQAVTVTAGTLTQKTFSYDQAATLNATLVTDPLYALPTSRPQIALYNTSILPLGVKTVVNSGGVTTIGNLWPYTNGYEYWAGSCKQSDPLVSGGPRDPVVNILPGTTANKNIRLAPVQVNVTLGGLPLLLATVTATPFSNINCLAPDTLLTLGTTVVGGVLMTSLPPGKWILKVNGKSGSITTGTLLQTSAASSYSLAVS
jgi:prepilin-type N-terminal cleavage/methylation domain-containing protein